MDDKKKPGKVAMAFGYIVVFGVIIGIIVGISTLFTSYKPSAKGPSGPIITIAPTATDAPTLTPNPTPLPTPQTLLDLSGSGQAQTAAFTTGDNWAITYTFNCSSFGSQGNFQIYINNTDSSENDDTGANQLAASGGSTDHYYDAGKHYLQINSECAWHLTVTQ
jgi:hypothetical protein